MVGLEWDLYLSRDSISPRKKDGRIKGFVIPHCGIIRMAKSDNKSYL